MTTSKCKSWILLFAGLSGALLPGAISCGGRCGGFTPCLPALANVSPVSLSFPNQTVGTTSAPMSVTLTNNGDATLKISNITLSGDFSENHNCAADLAPSAKCTISVTFAPTMTGARAGALTIASNDPTSPTMVSLSGMGV